VVAPVAPSSLCARARRADGGPTSACCSACPSPCAERLGTREILHPPLHNHLFTGSSLAHRSGRAAKRETLPPYSTRSYPLPPPSPLCR
jgi:hypothetical protein